MVRLADRGGVPGGPGAARAGSAAWRVKVERCPRLASTIRVLAGAGLAGRAAAARPCAEGCGTPPPPDRAQRHGKGAWQRRPASGRGRGPRPRHPTQYAIWNCVRSTFSWSRARRRRTSTGVVEVGAVQVDLQLEVPVEVPVDADAERRCSLRGVGRASRIRAVNASGSMLDDSCRARQLECAPAAVQRIEGVDRDDAAVRARPRR